MSGFVCIWNLEGEPVNRDLLSVMTDAMSFRGPDRGGTWIDGTVGMGHRLLITTFEAEFENQPCTLDGTTYIVADARIDDRDRLKRELHTAGQQVAGEVTDVELILHAYQVWSEQCVDHLLGDFSFVIWDGHEQRVFCGRDHWGIRLLYYAKMGSSLVISNTLNVVRLHPTVSDRRNDLAIADLLLFDFNQDVSTTTFADIHRLPPAYTMCVCRDDVRYRRYWTLPYNQQVRFKRDEDYVERFKELLQTAVADRLRTDRVGILMSGGLDSTTIVAAAKQLTAASRYELHAHCFGYEHLIRDEEPKYARLAAERLKIPIHFRALDETALLVQYQSSSQTIPEPFHWWRLDSWRYILKPISQSTRVLFYGEDVDSLLRTGTVADMFASQGIWLTLHDVIKYVWHYRRRPAFGFGLLKRFAKPLPPRIVRDYPTWLNPDFERKHDLTQRWLHFSNSAMPKGTHRPIGYELLTSPRYQGHFESLDPGITSFAVRLRMPYFDLRLAMLLFSVPILPWTVRKELLRQAGRGTLPEEIRTRPKTPSQTDPIPLLIQVEKQRSASQIEWGSRALEYIVPEKITSMYGASDWDYTNLRPFCLNAWLKACYDRN